MCRAPAVEEACELSGKAGRDQWLEKRELGLWSDGMRLRLER